MRTCSLLNHGFTYTGLCTIMHASVVEDRRYRTVNQWNTYRTIVNKVQKTQNRSQEAS